MLEAARLVPSRVSRVTSSAVTAVTARRGDPDAPFDDIDKDQYFIAAFRLAMAAAFRRI
jgi:hypothetical protein